MSTTIVSAIFNNLHGTDYGGRPSRETHYYSSLKTLTRMSDAKFIIYTNEPEKLGTYLKENGDAATDITLIPFDLNSTPHKDKIQKLKDLEEMKKSFRCFELQYLKIYWLLNHLPQNDTDHIYWFDAGLSYSGLIPDKHLNIAGNTYYDKYFNSHLYNNNFLKCLIDYTKDKFFVIAKNNTEFFWSQTIPDKYYTNLCKEHHIIGGFFGGQKLIVNTICNKFLELLMSLLNQENELYSEEQIMTALYYNDPNLFQSIFFDLWWHEDNVANLFEGKENEVLSKSKSFYKILEELNC
jgi:hypothetical protein